MKKTHITDVDVTTSRVTLRVNGEPIAIVRVPDGSNFGWRVQFGDHTLGSGIFANPERALRWIASGRPVHRGEAVPETTVMAVPFKMREKRFEDEEDDDFDPGWEVIKREPRSGPVWNGTMSSMPGGPTLLDPTRLLRSLPAVKPGARIGLSDRGRPIDGLAGGRGEPFPLAQAPEKPPAAEENFNAAGDRWVVARRSPQ